MHYSINFEIESAKSYSNPIIVQEYPIVFEDQTPKWTKIITSWPRKLTAEIKLEKVAIRYNVLGKDIYREDVWNGKYTVDMFQKLTNEDTRLPPNFVELLDSPWGGIEESIIQFDSSESLQEGFLLL